MVIVFILWVDQRGWKERRLGSKHSILGNLHCRGLKPKISSSNLVDLKIFSRFFLSIGNDLAQCSKDNEHDYDFTCTNNVSAGSNQESTCKYFDDDQQSEEMKETFIQNWDPIDASNFTHEKDIIGICLTDDKNDELGLGVDDNPFETHENKEVQEKQYCLDLVEEKEGIIDDSADELDNCDRVKPSMALSDGDPSDTVCIPFDLSLESQNINLIENLDQDATDFDISPYNTDTIYIQLIEDAVPNAKVPSAPIYHRKGSASIREAREILFSEKCFAGQGEEEINKYLPNAKTHSFREMVKDLTILLQPEAQKAKDERRINTFDASRRQDTNDQEVYFSENENSIEGETINNADQLTHIAYVDKIIVIQRSKKISTIDTNKDTRHFKFEPVIGNSPTNQSIDPVNRNQLCNVINEHIIPFDVSQRNHSNRSSVLENTRNNASNETQRNKRNGYKLKTIRSFLNVTLRYYPFPAIKSTSLNYIEFSIQRNVNTIQYPFASKEGSLLLSYEITQNFIHESKNGKVKESYYNIGRRNEPHFRNQDITNAFAVDDQSDDHSQSDIHQAQNAYSEAEKNFPLADLFQIPSKASLTFAIPTFLVYPVTSFLPSLTEARSNEDFFDHVGYRLASLSTIPPSCKISRVRLADAGFHYDRRKNKDAAICHRCNASYIIFPSSRESNATTSQGDQASGSAEASTHLANESEHMEFDDFESDVFPLFEEHSSPAPLAYHQSVSPSCPFLVSILDNFMDEPESTVSTSEG